MSSNELRQSVVSQIDWWWHALFRRRLDGLTDEELWWQPSTNSWTLTRGADGQYRYEWPPGSQGEAEPPLTTLAWRLCHMSLAGLAHWALVMEGDPDGAGKAFVLPFPERAEDAVATTDAWWTRWRAAVQELDDEVLWQPIARTPWCGELGDATAVMNLGPADPVLNFVLHQQRELIHHGAEISLLRDLFRAEHG